MNMNLADKLKNNLFHLVAGGVLVFALSSACLSCTYIRPTDWQVLGTALLAMAFFCLWFFNKHTFWIGLCLLLGGVLITWLYLHIHQYDVAWFNRLVPYLADLISHIRGLTGYYERYAVLGTVIIWGFALVTAAAIRGGGGFYPLSLLGFGMFGVMSYLQYHVGQLYLLCFLFVFITLLARRLAGAAARAGGDLAINVSGLLLLPLCLVLIWIAGGLPQPQAANSRNIRDNVALNLSALDELFYSTFAPKYFSFSTTGFSAAGGRLGGNVTPNARYVMSVYAPEGARPYLAGAYKDVYEGDRWSWSRPGAPLPVLEAGSVFAGWADVGDNNLTLDYYTQIMGMGGLERDVVWKELMRSYQLLTVYPGRTTRSVFAPAETMLAHHWEKESEPVSSPLSGALTQSVLERYLSAEAGLAFHRTSQGALESAGSMVTGTAYTVAYRPYMMHETTRAMRTGDWTGYFITNPEDLDESLAPYLALPQDLPQRVRDLALAIVAESGAQNPYAKMKALEEYLHQFPYTLTPGPVPAGVDFVDYFLFEGQQGYCTYYATALAVMGRCVGVPTRYGEGYTLPMELNADGGYDVTNAQAHAWCEAFFTPTGWTVFEATAPYAAAFYATPGETPSHDTYDAADYPDVNDFREDDLMADIRNQDMTRPGALPDATETPESLEADQGGRTGLFLLTLLGLLAAAMAVAGGRYWLYQRRLRQLESLPNREAALAYYRRILKLLEARGAPLMPGETAGAYSARLDGAQSGGPHHRLAAIFCRAAYSPHDITDDQRAALAQGYHQLLTAADTTPGARAKSLVERYVLGKY